ncbi:MAG: extracellular solute-binding protein, partial [Spirochaetales bacterium]|nr:extracellular solute-binding protein [Spirochaetales bacterium]
MKKTALAICIVLLAITAMSCSGKKGTERDGKTLVQIVAPDNTYGLSTDPDLQEAITAMIEEKADVAVDAIVPPLASFTDKLATLINSGDIPDVFIASQAMARVPQMVAREQILDITEYIENSPVLSKIDRALMEQLEIDGSLYAVPYSFSRSKAIYLRKDIM